MSTAKEAQIDMGKLLDRLPMAFIVSAVTLLVQFGVIISWGAKLDTRVTAVEMATQQNTASIEAMKTQFSSVNVSLARIQERQTGQTDNIKEIKDIVKDLRK